MKTNMEIELRVLNTNGLLEAERVLLSKRSRLGRLLEFLGSRSCLEAELTLWRIGELPCKDGKPLAVRFPCSTFTLKLKEKLDASRP
jgi:hypothetical protein